MLERTVTDTTVCNTVDGLVSNRTEEYYTEATECYARGNELRADENVAFVLDGYWWPTHNYRVAYAYKA